MNNELFCSNVCKTEWLNNIGGNEKNERRKEK
jgi:hypothetical protein